MSRLKSLARCLLALALSLPVFAATSAYAKGKPPPKPSDPPADTALIGSGKVSGEAYSVLVDVDVLPGLLGGLVNVTVGPTPYVKLAPYGGFDAEALARINVLDLVGSKTLTNITVGGVGPNKAGSFSASEVEDLSLLGGLIQADVLGTYCSSYGNGTVAASGADSVLLGLKIGGKAISLQTPPNTSIDLLVAGGLLGSLVKVATVVVNEQIPAGNGTTSSQIDASALHVTITEPQILSLLLGKLVDGEIVVSATHCDVVARPNDGGGGGGGGGGEGPPASPGFVTGGGRIDSPTGFATFGFNARLNRGQLEYQDHGTGMNFHGDTVTSFSTSGTCATFSGGGTLNGVGGHAYTATACDNGEPGIGVDTFAINIDSGAYTNSGTLRGGAQGGGNIQLH